MSVGGKGVLARLWHTFADWWGRKMGKWDLSHQPHADGDLRETAAARGDGNGPPPPSDSGNILRRDRRNRRDDSDPQAF